MAHLFYRNVNDAFRGLVRLMAHPTDRVPRMESGSSSWVDFPVRRSLSRNGSVMVIDEPVTITYSHPRERVLFNAARDANPFFHLYESLWMLAGRNDVAPLAYYAKQMLKYSDDGKTLNGAYGYRWRHARVRGKYWKAGDSTEVWENQSTDQLDIIVNHLKADPHSRRAVLQMWNVEDDLLKVGKTGAVLGENEKYQMPSDASKDVCCNLSVLFSIRHDRRIIEDGGDGDIRETKHLDMTVTNRSNDTVWGTLGANYVHFTFLQEYMAAKLGVEVGRYHHFSNNLHVYDEPGNPNIPPWKPDEWLADDPTSPAYGLHYPTDGRHHQALNSVPLVKDPAAFDAELPSFVGNAYGKGVYGSLVRDRFTEPFLRDVAVPAALAFDRYRNEKAMNHAMACCDLIQADDWRIACTAWLKRRAK